MCIQVKRGDCLVAKNINLDLTGTGFCASFNFRRTARAITRLYDSRLMASGIRSTQFAILVGIAKNQPVPIAALADMLVTDQTTLSRSLRLLQKQGLITISGRSTMRQRFLAITPKGERTLQRTLPLWRKMQADFISKVGSNQWHELRNELENIARFAIDDAKTQSTSAHGPRE